MDGWIVAHHRHVALRRKVSITVQDESYAARHSSCEIASGGSQDESDSSGHVLAPVITDTFHNGCGSGIADAETFSGYTTDEYRAGSGAIKTRVASDDVLLRPEDGCFGRINSHVTSGESFGYVVVGITFERDTASGDEEGAETLAG